MSTKKQDRTAAALAAMGLGAQVATTPPPTLQQPLRKTKPDSAPPKVQVSVQFTVEGLKLLRQAQARLLERGVPRSGMKGVALEVVLKEWLSQE